MLADFVDRGCRCYEFDEDSSHAAKCHLTSLGYNLVTLTLAFEAKCRFSGIIYFKIKIALITHEFIDDFANRRWKTNEKSVN